MNDSHTSDAASVLSTSTMASLKNFFRSSKKSDPEAKAAREKKLREDGALRSEAAFAYLSMR